MVNYSFLKFDKSTQLRYKPYSNIISRIIWQHCERNKNDFKRLRSYFKYANRANRYIFAFLPRQKYVIKLTEYEAMIFLTIQVDPMIQCGLRKLPSPIVGDLRYLRRLSSSCDYSTKTLSQRYPDSRGCTLREGCDVMPLAVTLFVIFHCLINRGEIQR